MNHLNYAVILCTCINLPNEQIDTSMAARLVRRAGPHTPEELVGKLDVARFVSIPTPGLMIPAVQAHGILAGAKSEHGSLRCCHTGRVAGYR